MKSRLLILLSLMSVSAWAQQDTSASKQAAHAVYERHSVTATASLGFVDGYKQNYALPAGFVKNNTSGYHQVYTRLEYGLTRYISIGATFSYDAFTYNFGQQYTGNSGAFTRYRTDNLRLLSGGVVAYYHLNNVIRVRNLDPFLGIGVSLNNIRHSNYPQGDSTVINIDHTITPYLKVGARYYISSVFSVFADAGYDKESIFSLGASCRFFSRKKMPTTITK
jgi:hypothetical protein